MPPPRQDALIVSFWENVTHLFSYSPIHFFTSKTLVGKEVSKLVRKAAFTLAEVLITLGIIGVVAAITIPTILSKIDDRQNIVRWKKMYSVINQAFLETIEEGYAPCNPNDRNNTCLDVLSWVRQTDMNPEFINQMMKKFKVVKHCASSNRGDKFCGPTYGFRYKTLAGSGTVGAYNMNDSYWLDSGELIMFGGTHGGPWISVDVNGFGNGKDTVGKDFFTIRVYDNFLRPMGAQGTYSLTQYPDGCGCSKDIGVESSPYITDAAGQNIVSGACCSAYYLYGK